MTAILFFSMNTLSSAADSFDIYSDKTGLVENEVVFIPVKIRDNKGIMGFRITVEYSVKDVKIMSVTKGNLISKGNFNTSYTSSTNGSFDVVWNYTEDISDDGILFVIGVKALHFFEESSIKLKYSQEDTFNEKWQDVSFDCKSVNLFCLTEKQTTAKTDADNYLKKTDSMHDIQIDENHVISAVNITLSQMGYNSIPEIKEKDMDSFVSAFNNNLKEISGEEHISYNNLRDIELNYNVAFENKFIQETNDLVEASVLKATIESAIKEVKSDDIKNIDEKKEKKFLKAVQEKLQELNPDVPSLCENVDQKIALKTVKKLYGGLALTQTDKVIYPKEDTNNPGLKVFILLAVLGLFLVVFILIKKAKKRKESIDK